VQLDLDNPRIKRFVEKYGSNPTAEQIALALGAGSGGEDAQSGPTFQSLRESIRTNGGIIQPIIVNKNQDGEHVVVEGNTRLSIYREFDESGVKGDWKKIPAIVHDNLSLAGVDAIRLQAHLVGPRQWDPYSKAKYLHHLRNCEHLTMNQVVDYCGGKKKEVEDYIDAYNDMEKYYRPILGSDSEFDSRRFSAFVEVQKTNIKKSILDAGFGLGDFSKWVHDQIIYPLNTVRQLPQILINKDARETFLKDGAKEAIKVLNIGTDASLQKADIESLAAALYKKLSTMPMDEFKDMKKDLNKQKVVALFSLEEELLETCKMLRDEE
jgi:hypothetical protein